MHSLTPVTPPTTDLPALRIHRREGREGWLRPVEVYAVQVQWNQASIPSFNRRRPALMWKYSTHSAAFKVRSHTPARTMTHVVLRLLPPPPSQLPLSGGWSRANEHRRACISTNVIELRFRGRRPPMGRRSTLCGCRQGCGTGWNQNFREWVSREWKGISFNDSFLNEDQEVGFKRWKWGSWETV